MKKRRFVLAALTLALSACASASGGGSASSGTLRAEVGPAVPSAVEREAVQALERHGYRLLRRDMAQDRLMLETEWLRRAPAEAENAAGVRDARSRVVVTTRPRGTVNSTGQSISGVTIMFELQHLFGPDSDWTAATMIPDEAAARFKQITDEIRQELQVKGMNGQP